MIETDFTKLIGCEAPIQQAPMGKGATTPSLAAAVANAGGLGMLSLSGYAVDVIENVIRETYRLTSKKIGANFLLYQPIDIESLEVTAELVDFGLTRWACFSVHGTSDGARQVLHIKLDGCLILN